MRTRTQIPIQILKGEAALEALVKTHKLLDWQAKKVLGVARWCGLINFPINSGWDLMSVKYAEGSYVLGPADFSGVTR